MSPKASKQSEAERRVEARFEIPQPVASSCTFTGLLPTPDLGHVTGQRRPGFAPPPWPAAEEAQTLSRLLEDIRAASPGPVMSLDPLSPTTLKAVLHARGYDDAVIEQTLGVAELLSDFLVNTFAPKTQSYGVDNLEDLGIRGVFVRLHDKIKRLKQLIWLGHRNVLTDETVTDTFSDALGYSIQALRLIKKGIN